MQLIDGYNGGIAHISAGMIRDHNLSMYGTDDCVLEVGNKFAYEIVNNNLIRIKDGMAIIGGARAIIEYGQQETATIENGVSGYKRNDLIVIEYNKDNETLKETTTLKVVKGTLGSDGVDPALVTGDIRSGAAQRQMALYRVRIDGLSIEGVDKLWTAGAIPIANGGTGAITASGALAALGGCQIKKLWENDLPNNEFAAQTIPIPHLYEYDAVVVRCKTYTQEHSEIIMNIKTLKGSVESHCILFPLIRFRRRYINFNNNGMIFSAGEQQTSYGNDTTTTLNVACRPIEIYGIKGVDFNV